MFSKLLTLVPFFCTLSPSLALPHNSLSLSKRATTICGQWDSLAEGQYTIYQDLWGQASATSGSQCTTFNSLSGNNIVWSTSWSWAGGNTSMKSFAQVNWNPERVLSSIKTIPATWHWTYSGSGITADVTYDTWLGTSTTASSDYEVMIWLAALGGAGPISSTGSLITTVTLAGTSWKLFSGQNGSFKVFSFVASTPQQNFSGDLKVFYQYLISNEGVPASRVLQSIAGGTEPFVGSNAVLSTSAYSVSST